MFMDLGFTQNSSYMFQLYVDDYSRVSYFDVITTKTDVLPKWVDLKAHLENNFQPWKFAFIKTDSESIYHTPAWEEHCKYHGMVHEVSSPHKHGQLGVAERAMQTVGTSFRCMMITGNAPERCVPSALMFANVIRNHSPTKANNGWTPLEKQEGKKLPVNKRLLQGPLFCLVFAHVYEQQRVKHGRRGVACVYLGYLPQHNTYLVMEWESGREYYTADIEFFPNIFPFRANPQKSLGSLNQWDDLAPNTTDVIETGDDVKRRQSIRQRGYRFSGGEEVVNIPDVDVPPESISNLITGEENSIARKFGRDPESMEEALQMHDADEWIMADMAEKESFKFHKVASVVQRSVAASRGKRVFGNKTVFKRKFNPPDEEHPLGSLDKHKVRVTIRAFTKQLKEGIDYKEKHAGTVRWNAIKMLFAIAVKFDLDIALFDISTFFLYGDMEEEVYMEIPERWKESWMGTDPIWLLHKSVYGWPAAPHCAQRKLKTTYAANGDFRPTSSDDCVYVSTDHTTGYCASGTHVDDIFSVGDKDGIQKLKSTLESQFKITVKMNPSQVTGVEIIRHRDRKWAKLHQTEYCTKLLEKYGMLDSRPTDTPMDPGTAKAIMMLPQDDFTTQSIHEYHAIVGSLMWIQQRTRPDLNFTVNLLCRFLRCASPKHVAIAKGRPLRYLNGTRNFGLVYQPGDSPWVLSGSSDADLAGDLGSSRSVLSIDSKLGEFGSINSSCSLERKICTSTGQAETYAFSSLAKEILWERHALSELGFPQKGHTECLTDNDGVIIQSTKAVNHAMAKHYRIAQAFIRQVCDDGLVKAVSVDTRLNPSDLGTKALHSPSFIRHRDAIMGPQEVPPKKSKLVESATHQAGKLIGGKC